MPTIDVQPLCRGLHLQGSNFLRHWIDGKTIHTMCNYCNARWEIHDPPRMDTEGAKS